MNNKTIRSPLLPPDQEKIDSDFELLQGSTLLPTTAKQSSPDLSARVRELEDQLAAVNLDNAQLRSSSSPYNSGSNEPKISPSFPYTPCPPSKFNNASFLRKHLKDMHLK